METEGATHQHVEAQRDHEDAGDCRQPRHRKKELGNPVKGPPGQRFDSCHKRDRQHQEKENGRAMMKRGRDAANILLRQISILGGFVHTRTPC
ncbi:hypothetical protein [Pseudorhizobium banfieldiae]|uniref:hypothetical protein n=1 Tax=Pseudorhizobium banfieldiae TaxID=1125847 RepID=UPI000696803D|nr:hypothetical protein [Pseudorhizobium banfieldiae]